MTRGSHTMQLILGSSSKYRKEILQQAGFFFTTLSPDIDERKIRDDDPVKLTLAIAKTKAEALIPEITEPALLITADQVTVCNGQIYEKPRSEKEARLFLENYIAHPSPKAVNSIVLINTQTGKRASGTDIATVHLKLFSKELIETFIAEKKIFSCAGALSAVDDNGNIMPYVKKIDGSPDSVKGLPLQLLKRLIEKVGWISKTKPWRSLA